MRKPKLAPVAEPRRSEGAPELFPIRTLAQLTGVNPVTLRAWERRYGVLTPKRTPKGHRLYSRDDVELVHRILALTARGVSIGQVKDVLARVPVETEQSGAGGPDDAWVRARGRMVMAITRFDEDELESTYNEALGMYAADVVNARLIVPLLRELGRRWETTEGSVAEEHFFGVYLRNKLGARFHHRPRTARGPKLLVACWPGEHHEIGLLLFALAAGLAEFRTVLLGANMPLEELPLAARRSGADAIVLSGSIRPAAQVLDEGLPALVAAASVPVAAGGLSSVKCHDAILRAGATPLGEDMGQALRQLATLIDRA
jgi:DNA-binding transcriptional MerR regulator